MTQETIPIRLEPFLAREGGHTEPHPVSPPVLIQGVPLPRPGGITLQVDNENAERAAKALGDVELVRIARDHHPHQRFRFAGFRNSTNSNVVYLDFVDFESTDSRAA